MTDSFPGYIDFYAILGLDAETNPGAIRNTYKKLMKQLLVDISKSQQTGERIDHFILEMAKLNAAVYVLRDKETRETYDSERASLIALEQEWCALPESDRESHDKIRRQFDARVRAFLSKYVEESVLAAALDKEVVETSHWNPAYTRHATRLLRKYRHGLLHDIFERLPFHEVTTPNIDWSERETAAQRLLAEAKV